MQQIWIGVRSNVGFVATMSRAVASVQSQPNLCVQCCLSVPPASADFRPRWAGGRGGSGVQPGLHPLAPAADSGGEWKWWEAGWTHLRLMGSISARFVAYRQSQACKMIQYGGSARCTGWPACQAHNPISTCCHSPCADGRGAAAAAPHAARHEHGVPGGRGSRLWQPGECQ